MSISFNETRTASDYMQDAPLFLGKKPGLFNTVYKPYPKIWGLYKKMKSLEWSESEFDYSQCLTDFKTCPKEVSDIMIRTLAWQWEADSVASRAIAPVLAPFITDSSLWAAWLAVSVNECYTGDHEALTPDGWVRLDELTTDHKIMQWNAETFEMDFVNPSRVFSKEYQGDMYHFQSDFVDQLVTPNHRMPVMRFDYETDKWKMYVYTAEQVEYNSNDFFPTVEDNRSGVFIEKTKVENFSGKVYCPTVPTGFFVVRHNDKVTIGGNCTHSATYSEIVRMSFDDPEKVLSDILAVQESFRRMDVVNEQFDRLYEIGHKYALGQVEDDEAYEAAFMGIVALLLLERIQFMASFSITFTICSLNWFQPAGKAVQKICQDELEVHAELDKEVIRTELATERGWKVYQKNKDVIKKMIDEVVQSELVWVDYLFSEGRELVGTNAQKVKEWVLFNARDVYVFLDVPSDYKFPKHNPMPNLEKWINISMSQTAPQECDNNAYKLNTIVRDDDKIDFDADF